MRDRERAIRAALNPLVISLLLLVSGCSKTEPVDPFVPELQNNTDNFELQATEFKSITQTLNYTWQHTGSEATIDQSSAISSGTATLEITDKQFDQVYSKSLKENGTFTTLVGDAGNWKIKVSLTNCSGTINFRVQKKA